LVTTNKGAKGRDDVEFATIRRAAFVETQYNTLPDLSWDHGYYEQYSVRAPVFHFSFYKSQHSAMLHL